MGKDLFYLVAIGSSLGDREAIFISVCSKLRPDRMSSIYKTQPVGAAKQEFWNAVMRVGSALHPEEFWKVLQKIEDEHGRTRQQRWSDRTLDLDILWWSGGDYRSFHLEIPHPRFLQRDFTLLPAQQIGPELELRELKIKLGDYKPDEKDFVRTGMTQVDFSCKHRGEPSNGA